MFSNEKSELDESVEDTNEVLDFSKYLSSDNPKFLKSKSILDMCEMIASKEFHKKTELQKWAALELNDKSQAPFEAAMNFCKIGLRDYHIK